MASKIFIFVCIFLLPSIMLFFGMKFKNHAPKNINRIYGYRTSMSMKNKETWEFAHQYCGKLWIKLGFILLIFSIVGTTLIFAIANNLEEIIVIILLTLQTIILIASIFPVEKALKKYFDENGNRKN